MYWFHHLIPINGMDIEESNDIDNLLYSNYNKLSDFPKIKTILI